MDLPDSLPEGQHAVYALIDPTDQLVYYVGQTRHPKKRLGEHFKSRRYYGKKAEWLRSLAEKGQRPLMQILEIVSDEATALKKEQEWIRHFIEQGRPLLNAQAQPRPVRETGPLFALPEKFSIDDFPPTSLLGLMYRAFYPEGKGQPMSEPQPGATTQQQPDKLTTTTDAPLAQLRTALDGIQKVLDNMQYTLRSMEQQETRFNEHTERIAAFEQRLNASDANIAASEQEGTNQPDWMPLLSAAHLARAQELLGFLAEKAGHTRAQVEQEMLETFNVAAINAIPDKRWSAILYWYFGKAQQPR